VKLIVPATRMDVKIDNEDLMRNICPLSAIRGSAATGGFHLTGGQKHLKYRQGYHPKEELQADKRNLHFDYIRCVRTECAAAGSVCNSKAIEREDV
jgi:hypothetical protein